MIMLQLKANSEHHYLSCKYHFKIKDPTSDCSFFDINTYLVTFWRLCEDVAATANQNDITEFVNILKNNLKTQILVILVISLLPFIFLFYQFRLVSKLNTRRSDFRVSDHTIMVERLQSEEDLKIKKCEEYLTSLLHRAGYSDQAKVLKIQIATSEDAVKDMESRLEEAEFELKCLKEALDYQQFTKAQLKDLFKYEKKLTKKIKK